MFHEKLNVLLCATFMMRVANLVLASSLLMVTSTKVLFAQRHQRTWPSLAGRRYGQCGIQHRVASVFTCQGLLWVVRIEQSFSTRSL
jgi:hypothetical protein